MLTAFLRAPLRQLVLALVLIGIVGLEVELALLRHAESFSQWIPHVALMVGLVSTVAVYFRPNPSTIRVFQAIMLSFVIVGLLGLYFHFRGNLEFALERDPSLTGMRLVWKALRGATPALAPGALAQLGLLGLIYTLGHPVIAGSSAQAGASVH
ncbi:MAG TPA: hypothetical protein VD771_04200 [Gemmatimonadaceae bacterium]|nr:hypothetical protein [Gemmatimonadaceae bacterium]